MFLSSQNILGEEEGDEENSFQGPFRSLLLKMLCLIGKVRIGGEARRQALLLRWWQDREGLNNVEVRELSTGQDQVSPQLPRPGGFWKKPAEGSVGADETEVDGPHSCKAHRYNAWGTWPASLPTPLLVHPVQNGCF